MGSPRIRLVPTGPAEMPALRRLFDDPSFHGWGGASPLSDDELAAKYAGDRLPEVESFIVEVDAEPAGLAILHDEGDRTGGMDLILLPSTRGHGVGRAVVELLVERARDVHGWSRLTIDPDLSNVAGIRFWEATGFRAVREEPGSNGREAFLLMERALAEVGSPER